MIIKGNNENRWIFICPSYDELLRIAKSETLWISPDWNKGMCPDGDDAKQKLEYTWVNGAIPHIHKVLQIFLYSRTSTQRLPQEQSNRTRYDKSGKCEIF